MLSEQESSVCDRRESVLGPVTHVSLVLTELDRGVVWRYLV